MTSISSKPPTGTVTFLFTDIVGSTEMWEQHGDAFLPVLQAHNAILSAAIEQCGGFLIKTEGDAYKVAFADPAAAVRCAILAQAALQRYPWPPDVGPVQVRMAVHTGRPFMQADDYFGPPLNRTARILSTTYGGQIILSEDTLTLVENRMERETRFEDLGYHQLRDLDQPIRLFQVGHPTVRPHRFPAPRSLNGHAHNLPSQRTSFIGREKEMERIAALLARDDTPLLTLTGPQGIGKTRLSIQAAAEIIELFPDGVWYIRFTNACDVTSALMEMARALGISVPPGASTANYVRDWLARRRCLLILDDCGHVPEAVRLIHALLSGSPSLRCLATSRTSLQVEGGTELEVPEFSLPPVNADAKGVMESEAGRLFVERAVDARPDFEITDQRAKPVSRLLHLLGGVPESIEKAAEMTHSRQVTPARILDALSPELRQSAQEVGQAAAARGKELLARLRQSPGLAALLQSLGGVAADRRDLDEAERKCREALTIYDRSHDRQGIAATLRQMGNIAFARKDYRRAVLLLGAAHQTYAELGSPEMEAVAADLECARRALGRDASAVALPLEQAIEVALGSRE
jgi:class 3 adenylate cyclase